MKEPGPPPLRILGCGDRTVRCKMFSSIRAHSPQDAGSSPSSDNRECSQTSPGVPWGQNRSQLRSALGVSDGEPRAGVLEEKAREEGEAWELCSWPRQSCRGRAPQLIPAGAVPCPLYDRPLLLPRGGRGRGLSCGP